MSDKINDALNRLRTKGALRPVSCQHLSQAQDVVKPNTAGCEECLAVGDRWIHLRVCLICGHVGCCDSSKNKHASRHYQETGHAIAMSMEPGEDWVWCFADKELIVPARA